MWRCGLGAFSTATPARSTGRIFLALNPGLDDVGGTADPRGHRDGGGRAIKGAGPTFHAAVAVDQPGLLAIHFKNAVGADNGAQAAPHAFFAVERQSGNIRQMSEFFHKDTSFQLSRDAALTSVPLPGGLP